jgi:hypothetical protein
MNFSQQQPLQVASRPEAHLLGVVGGQEQAATELPVYPESAVAESLVQQQDDQHQGQHHMHAIPKFQGMRDHQGGDQPHQCAAEANPEDKTNGASVSGQDSHGIMPLKATLLSHNPAQQLLLHSQEQLQLQLLLKGGDLLLLQGEGRYDWLHGIDGVEHELLLCSDCMLQRECTVRIQHAGVGCSASSQATAPDTGQACQACVHVVRGRRVSITLRKMDPGCTTLCTEM